MGFHAMRRQDVVTQTSLRTLQYEQQQHDEIAHRDVLSLPLDRRITHMVLHFSKYTGRLLSEEGRQTTRIERILVDTAIICLASANALGVRLADQMTCEVAERPQGVLSEWLGIRLAVEAGRMAKACESLDHVEDLPYREIWEEGVLAITALVLRAAEAFGLNLAKAIRQRWAGIETKVTGASKPERRDRMSVPA
jgi:hypothetical protein